MGQCGVGGFGQGVDEADGRQTWEMIYGNSGETAKHNGCHLSRLSVWTFLMCAIKLFISVLWER